MKIMMTLHILFIFIFFPSSTSISSTKVILGNTLLRENGYEILFNQRIGILSNPTGIYDDSLVHIVDAISESLGTLRGPLCASWAAFGVPGASLHGGRFGSFLRLSLRP